MAPDRSVDEIKLRRSFGLFSAVMLGIGAIIGAGIFVLSGIAAGEAGPAFLLALGLNGIAALCIGACYSELASAMPRAGGSYYWIKTGTGHFAGFLAGWICFYADTVAVALYAKAFGSFAISLLLSGGFVAAEIVTWQPTLIALGVLVGVTIIEYRGAKDTVLSENIIVTLKIALLLVFAIFGFAAIFQKPEPTAALHPFFPEGIGGLVIAMALTFIAFEGFEVITRSGEEIRNPQKNIPKAIFLSILISLCLYLMVAIVMLTAIEAPNGEPTYKYLGSVGELGMAKVAGKLISNGETLFYVMGMASAVSAMIAATYSATRVGFAMGRGADIPSTFAHVHPSFASPYVSILACSSIAAFMIASLPLREIASGAGMMFAVLFALVCFTAWRLRKNSPMMKRPIRIPGLPIVSLVGIASCGLVFLTLSNVSSIAWLYGLGWLAAGLIVYFALQRRKLKRNNN